MDQSRSYPGQTSEDGEFKLEGSKTDGLHRILHHKGVYSRENKAKTSTCRCRKLRWSKIKHLTWKSDFHFNWKSTGSKLSNVYKHQYHQLDWQTPEELEPLLPAPQLPGLSAPGSWQPALFSPHRPQNVCSHLCDGIEQRWKWNEEWGHFQNNEHAQSGVTRARLWVECSKKCLVLGQLRLLWWMIAGLEWMHFLILKYPEIQRFSNIRRLWSSSTCVMNGSFLATWVSDVLITVIRTKRPCKETVQECSNCFNKYCCPHWATPWCCSVDSEPPLNIAVLCKP